MVWFARALLIYLCLCFLFRKMLLKTLSHFLHALPVRPPTAHRKTIGHGSAYCQKYFKTSVYHQL